MKSGHIILVTDTSIWIDLIKSGLLDAFFEIPYLICAADFIRDDESVDMGWDILEQKGLQFIGLSEDEVGEIYDLRQRHSSTSIADLASFFVARKSNGILLTGDQPLRKFAENQVEVHGFLWVMAQLVHENLLIPEDAINCLVQLQQYPNFRLPVDECQKLIRIWRKQL